MRERGFAPVFIIIAAVFIIGLVGAYYLGRSSSKPKETASPTPSPVQPQPPTVNSPVPTPIFSSPAPVDPQTESTYRSPDGKFQFNFPKIFITGGLKNSFLNRNTARLAVFSTGNDQIEVGIRRVNFVNYTFTDISENYTFTYDAKKDTWTTDRDNAAGPGKIGTSFLAYTYNHEEQELVWNYVIIPYPDRSQVIEIVTSTEVPDRNSTADKEKISRITNSIISSFRFN